MSDEEKNIEPIRDLLRQKLEASAPADEGWNVPSGKVWTGLSEELSAKRQAKRSTRRQGMLLSAVAILLAILLLRECGHQGQLEVLQSENGRLRDSYEKLRETCEERQASTVSAQAPAQNPVSTPSTDRSGVQDAARTPFDPSIANKGSAKGVARPNLSPPSVNKGGAQGAAPTPLSAPSAGGSMVLPETTLPPPPIFFSENTPAPTPLPAIPIELLNGELLQPRPLNCLLAGSEKPIRTPFALSAYGGAALTGNRLSGERPDIIARQKALIGWQMGMNLELPLSRHWSLAAGLRYSVSRIQTDYRLAVPFTHTNEYLHNDGNVDNRYRHSLPSSLGNYPAEFVLSRASDATVHEGEVMNLDLSIRQQTRLLGLPLQLRYGFGKGHWQAGIRAGLVGLHPMEVRAEGEPLLVSHHEAIHQRHTYVGSPSLGELRNLSLDASLGLDLRWQVSPRFGLQMETGWQRGLTPVFKDATLRNYLWEGSLRLGGTYWLR